MLQGYNIAIHSFKGYTPFIVIIKYWLYSLCCTIYPCRLFTLHIKRQIVFLNPLPVSCSSYLLFLIFLVGSLGFSICKIMSSANRDTFICFLIWMSFFFLSCFSDQNLQYNIKHKLARVQISSYNCSVCLNYVNIKSKK